MFSHEETERKMQNESKTNIFFVFHAVFSVRIEEIISKRYMPGWREVCDECSTTLFNCHYMCKICGYMICIECVHRYSQMNPEKRKSKQNKSSRILSTRFFHSELKRMCVHEDSYCLSEFLPWNGNPSFIISSSILFVSF